MKISNSKIYLYKPQKSIKVGFFYHLLSLQSHFFFKNNKTAKSALSGLHHMLLLSVVFLLTSSLSYSASGDGDWGWAASGFKRSWSTSASGLSLVSESSSRCDDPSPEEVFFPFGTTSCLRENAIVRVAVTLTWVPCNTGREQSSSSFYSPAFSYFFVCSDI